MEHTTESVTSRNVEAGDLVRSGQRYGQWLERAGAGDALVWPVPVVELLEFPRVCKRWDLFQISARQQREHVRHTEIGQSQQHGPSPCHSLPRHMSAPPALCRPTTSSQSNGSNQHG